MFSKIHEGREQAGVRGFVVDSLGIDSGTGSAARAATARLTLAWEAASKRVSAKNEADAQQRASEGPRTILKQDYLNAVKPLNDRHGEQPEELQSSQSYLEARLDQAEDGTFIAESWSEVTTADQDKRTGTSTMQITRDGKVSMIRGAGRAEVPRNVEELRERFKVMAHHWELVRLKLQHNPLVADYDFTSTWLMHVEWLVGKKVKGYTVKSSPTASAEHSLPWEQLLELDYRIRKLAVRTVSNSGGSLVRALEEARKDQPTLQQYLYIPLGLFAAEATASGSKRQAAGDDGRKGGGGGGRKDGAKGNGNRKPQKQQDNRGGGGQSWGGGKFDTKPKEEDSRAEWKAEASAYTPGPKRSRKCIPYQKGECKNKKCAFANVCFVCNQKHPQMDCDRRPKGAAF